MSRNHNFLSSGQPDPKTQTHKSEHQKIFENVEIPNFAANSHTMAIPPEDQTQKYQARNGINQAGMEHHHGDKELHVSEIQAEKEINQSRLIDRQFQVLVDSEEDRGQQRYQVNSTYRHQDPRNANPAGLGPGSSNLQNVENIQVASPHPSQVPSRPSVSPIQHQNPQPEHSMQPHTHRIPETQNLPNGQKTSQIDPNRHSQDLRHQFSNISHHPSQFYSSYNQNPYFQPQIPNPQKRSKSNLRIPQSQPPYTLILPWSRQYDSYTWNGFEENQYFQKIKKIDLTQLCYELGTLKQFLKARADQRCSWFTLILISITMIIVAILLIFSNSTRFSIPALALLSTSFAIFVLGAIFLTFKKSSYKRSRENAYRRVVSNLNASIFLDKPFLALVGPNGDYLEIRVKGEPGVVGGDQETERRGILDSEELRYADSRVRGVEPFEDKIGQKKNVIRVETGRDGHEPNAEGYFNGSLTDLGAENRQIAEMANNGFITPVQGNRAAYAGYGYPDQSREMSITAQNGYQTGYDAKYLNQPQAGFSDAEREEEYKRYIREQEMLKSDEINRKRMAVFNNWRYVNPIFKEDLEKDSLAQEGVSGNKLKDSSASSPICSGQKLQREKNGLGEESDKSDSSPKFFYKESQESSLKQASKFNGRLEVTQDCTDSSKLANYCKKTHNFSLQAALPVSANQNNTHRIQRVKLGRLSKSSSKKSIPKDPKSAKRENPSRTNISDQSHPPPQVALKRRKKGVYKLVFDKFGEHLPRRKIFDELRTSSKCVIGRFSKSSGRKISQNTSTGASRGSSEGKYKKFKKPSLRPLKESTYGEESLHVGTFGPKRYQGSQSGHKKSRRVKNFMVTTEAQMSQSNSVEENVDYSSITQALDFNKNVEGRPYFESQIERMQKLRSIDFESKQDSEAYGAPRAVRLLPSGLNRGGNGVNQRDTVMEKLTTARQLGMILRDYDTEQSVSDFDRMQKELLMSIPAEDSGEDYRIYQQNGYLANPHNLMKIVEESMQEIHQMELENSESYRRGVRFRNGARKPVLKSEDENDLSDELSGFGEHKEVQMRPDHYYQPKMTQKYPQKAQFHRDSGRDWRFGGDEFEVVMAQPPGFLSPAERGYPVSSRIGASRVKVINPDEFEVYTYN